MQGLPQARGEDSKDTVPGIASRPARSCTLSETSQAEGFRKGECAAGDEVGDGSELPAEPSPGFLALYFPGASVSVSGANAPPITGRALNPVNEPVGSYQSGNGVAEVVVFA
jgi:hypothetical protein